MNTYNSAIEATNKQTNKHCDGMQQTSYKVDNESDFFPSKLGFCFYSSSIVSEFRKYLER
jgi:hypothetical protein